MYNNIRIKIDGYEIDEALTALVKDKLGQDVDVTYMELIVDKLKNKHLLNDNDNEFSLFVEYNRGENETK